MTTTTTNATISYGILIFIEKEDLDKYDFYYTADSVYLNCSTKQSQTK